jgi:hypothetical protein
MNFYSADFPARAEDWTCVCGQYVPANYWHSHGEINSETYSRIGGAKRHRFRAQAFDEVVTQVKVLNASVTAEEIESAIEEALADVRACKP